MLLALFVSPAPAAVLDVGAGQAYPTISAALVVAANGDEIVVHDASWHEGVVVDALDLTLRSASGTHWRTPGAAPLALELTNGAHVVLEGFDLGPSVHRIDVHDGSTLFVKGCRFFGDAWIAASDTSDVVVRESDFYDVIAGVHHVGTGTIDIDRSRFVGSTIGCCEALVYASGGGPVLVRRSVFSGNTVDQGAVQCYGPCVVTDNVFVDNVGPISAVYAVNDDALLLRNRFCRGLGDDNGAVWLLGVRNAWVRNNAFLDETGASFSAAIRADTDGNVRLEHNTVLASTTATEGVVSLSGAGTFTMVGNLVAETTAPGVALGWYGGGGTFAEEYNAWYANGGGDANVALSPLDVVGVDPMLTGGAGCSWARVTPLPGSPLIDADPTLLDADGTPADIGATGGPAAP